LLGHEIATQKKRGLTGSKQVRQRFSEIIVDSVVVQNAAHCSGCGAVFAVSPIGVG
jgi:hypothetical protein